MQKQRSVFPNFQFKCHSFFCARLFSTNEMIPIVRIYKYLERYSYINFGVNKRVRPQQVSNDLLNLEELLDMQRQRHSPPRHKWFSRPFQHWLNAADAQCKRQRRRSKRADYSYSQLEWYVTSDGRFYVSFCSQFEINHLFLQSCVDIRIEHNYCK